MGERGEKTVGIIGGVGPEATIDLMQRILRLTPVPEGRDMKGIVRQAVNKY